MEQEKRWSKKPRTPILRSAALPSTDQDQEQSGAAAPSVGRLLLPADEEGVIACRRRGGSFTLLLTPTPRPPHPTPRKKTSRWRAGTVVADQRGKARPHQEYLRWRADSIAIPKNQGRKGNSFFLVQSVFCSSLLSLFLDFFPCFLISCPPSRSAQLLVSSAILPLFLGSALKHLFQELILCFLVGSLSHLRPTTMAKKKKPTGAKDASIRAMPQVRSRFLLSSCHLAPHLLNNA